MANLRQDQFPEQTSQVSMDDLWMNMQVSDAGDQRKVQGSKLPFQPRSKRAAWVFSNSTADADPGSGTLRLNNTTQSSTTYVYLNNLDESGTDWGSVFLGASIGTQFSIAESDSRYHVFTISAAVEDGTTYVKIPVTVNNSVSTLRDGNTVIVEGAESVAGANTVGSDIIVRGASDLSGALDSTKTYVIDGVIDMGNTSIIVPVGGLTMKGSSFETCGLISSEPSYTMFKSFDVPTGSGNLLITDLYISVTGTSSKVYELYDATGFNAFELTRVNYNDCTSLGDIYDYRQGLEFGTGRFGGSPSLTLHGLWRGGFRITTSIVRSLTGTMTEPLFKSGTLFQMNSRFLTDINCDLPSLAALHDFSPIEFPNPGTVQLKGCEVTRDGAYNADDSNLTPNMSKGDLCSYWKQNNGLPNTYVGGTSLIAAESITTINTIGVYELIAGTWANNELEHFSGTANGELQHLGINPREFEISMNLEIEGGNSDEISVQFFKYDDSSATEIPLTFTKQTRSVNNFVGGTDVAFFFNLIGVTLDQNDKLYMKVANEIDTSNVTVRAGSFFRLQER